MLNPRLVLGWAAHLAREAVRPPVDEYDCGRDRPLGSCGVLGWCCRPYVVSLRYTYRCALGAVTGTPGHTPRQVPA